MDRPIAVVRIRAIITDAGNLQSHELDEQSINVVQRRRNHSAAGDVLQARKSRGHAAQLGARGSDLLDSGRHLKSVKNARTRRDLFLYRCRGGDEAFTPRGVHPGIIVGGRWRAAQAFAKRSISLRENASIPLP